MELDRFVWRSALNLATDWSRHRTVRDDYFRGAMSDSADLAHPTETVLGTHERVECVARAHAALSSRCQEAFTLRILEDRPFKDVGRAMGISDRMAKIYVARALVSLRETLEHAERCAAQPPVPVGSGRRETPVA